MGVNGCRSKSEGTNTEISTYLGTHLKLIYIILETELSSFLQNTVRGLVAIDTCNTRCSRVDVIRQVAFLSIVMCFRHPLPRPSLDNAILSRDQSNKCNQSDA